MAYRGRLGLQRTPSREGPLWGACYGQEQDREKSQAAGFDHHLVNPVDMSKLMNLLD